MNPKALLMFEKLFIKDKQTIGNIFVIKTMTDKYLRYRRG
jgi:hypothetical protein